MKYKTQFETFARFLFLPQRGEKRHSKYSFIPINSVFSLIFRLAGTKLSLVQRSQFKKNPFVFSLAAILWFSVPASAQVCNTKQIAQNISPKSFTYAEIINTDNSTIAGSVTATATAPTIKVVPGLIWNRCIYGQKWDTVTKQCIGSPILLSWPEALQEADKMSGIIDGNVWRVPNIKELNSILDLQCINPPYNLEIFPNTFASEAHGLWTSSPHVESPTTTYTSAWYIDLSQGKLNYRKANGDISTKNFVRFVTN